MDTILKIMKYKQELIKSMNYLATKPNTIFLNHALDRLRNMYSGGGGAAANENAQTRVAWRKP